MGEPCNPSDTYADVKNYITQWKLAQQAGTPNLVPWPPRDERLALRCMDAYYNEQLAYYNGWCKQTQMKHIDLPGNLFTTWKSMPGRLVMYNTRKKLKADYEAKHPVNVGLSAATNPFADPAAVAAEREMVETLSAQAVGNAIALNAAGSGNAQLDQARLAHPDLPVSFVDGSPSLPALAAPPPRRPLPPPPPAPAATPVDVVQRGSGQQLVIGGVAQPPRPPPVAPPKEKSTLLVLSDEEAPAPKRSKTFPAVPKLGVDQQAEEEAPLTPAEMMKVIKELEKRNRLMEQRMKQQQQSSATPRPSPAASPKRKIKEEPK